MTGLYGKLPGHGDFVRRRLPQTFVEPWDDWLQQTIEQVRLDLDETFWDVWVQATPLRFLLPPSLCGADEVAGVLIASADSVGRLYPLTLVRVYAADSWLPQPPWFDALEEAGFDAIERDDSADVLLQQLTQLDETWAIDALAADAVSLPVPPPFGWWTASGNAWPMAALPSAAEFAVMLGVCE